MSVKVPGWRGDLCIHPAFDEALRGDPRSGTRPQAGSAACRDILELLKQNGSRRVAKGFVMRPDSATRSGFGSDIPG